MDHVAVKSVITKTFTEAFQHLINSVWKWDYLQ